MTIARARIRDAEITGYFHAGSQLPSLPDDLTSNPESGRFDPRQWFEHPEAPFELEIGSGKGAFLVAEGGARKSVNFLGIEWAREYAVYTADRARRNGLTNVRVLHSDATEFLRWRLPAGACSVIHLYFSDPWPKQRHHKRRVLQDAFLEDTHAALASDGELRIVTDHAGYWSWMEEHFARWCMSDRTGAKFERREFGVSDRAAGAGEAEFIGSNFERKYAREGRPFYAAVLVKA